MKALDSFISEIRKRVLVFDGSKGYMLQRLGMKGGECPELWNTIHSDEVCKVYRSYKEAGSDVIQTNTFQGNRIQLEKYSLGDKVYELNYEGTRLAKEIMGRDGFVAASIGPTGMLFEPAGDLTFNKAYDVFKEQVKAVVDGGADVINFETFTDLAEIRAALLAAKDVTDIPVICSVSFESNGKTLMGSDPFTVAVVLKSLGAEMIGTNCSCGPEHMLDTVRKLSEAGGVFLSVKPNAGLPELIEGEIVYRESADKFAELAGQFVKYGARLIGGCCGTTPEFIRAIRDKIKGIEPVAVSNRTGKIITSGVKCLAIETMSNIEIGRLSTEDDNELLNALKAGDVDIITEKAMDLSVEGYDAIYINIDEAGIEENLLGSVVNIAQGYIKEPFIIETKAPKALANALRLYKGKAGVVLNSSLGDDMQELLMAAKKYGSTVINDYFK